jgi:hypothetical protein
VEDRLQLLGGRRLAVLLDEAEQGEGHRLPLRQGRVHAIRCLTQRQAARVTEAPDLRSDVAKTLRKIRPHARRLSRGRF